VDDFLVREYLPGDEIAVNEAFNRAFGLARPRVEWEWKYPQEPEGRWIMIAVDGGGGVLAHYAAIPARVQVGALKVRAGIPTDAFSLPSIRPETVAAHAFARTTEVFFSRYGSPEGLALLFGLSGEYAPDLAVAQLTMKAVRPHRVEYWVRTTRRRHELTTGHEIREGFDHDTADRLWRRSAGRYEVAVIRNGAWLRRRFTGRPGIEYLHLSAWQRGEVHAWAVVHVQPPVTRWADLVWDGEDAGAVAALDRAITSGSLAVGSQRVEAWLAGDEAAAQTLRGLGWERREHPDRLALVARSFHPDIDSAMFSGRFYLTMGDSDLV
jgi:hypothetical protein